MDLSKEKMVARRKIMLSERANFLKLANMNILKLTNKQGDIFSYQPPTPQTKLILILKKCSILFFLKSGALTIYNPARKL